jgi:hypothetical protein
LPPSKSEMAEKTAWVGEKKKEGLIPKKVIKPKKDTPSTKNFKVQLPFLSYPLVLTRRPKNRKTVSKSVYVHEEKLVVVLQLNSGGKVKEFKLSDCGQELNVKFSNHVLAFNPEGIHDALYADHTLISGQTQEEYFTRLQAMEKAECSSNQDIGLQEMTILLDKPASVENMIQRSYVFEVTKDNPVQTSFAYFEFDTLKPKVDESTNVNKGDNVRFHEMKDDHNDSGSDGDCDNNANDDDHSHHHSNQQPRSQGGGQGGNGGNGGDNTNHNNNNTHQSRTPHRQQSTTFQQQQQHQGQGQGQSNMDIDSQSDHDNFDVSTQQKFEVELQKRVSVAKDEYKKRIEGRVNNFRENAKKERIESIRITKKLVNEKNQKDIEIMEMKKEIERLREERKNAYRNAPLSNNTCSDLLNANLKRIKTSDGMYNHSQLVNLPIDNDCSSTSEDLTGHNDDQENDVTTSSTDVVQDESNSATSIVSRTSSSDGL